MNLVIFGPPGAGKGTQSSHLCERFGLYHLSTGDLLRAERKAGNALGRQAEKMDRGEFVADEIVRDLVRTHAARAIAGGKGVLFDGYPRNVHQLSDLEQIIEDLGSKIDVALNLKVDPEKVVQRLSGRRTCSNPRCAQVYNLLTRPPAREGLCDKCGARLVQREDDRPDAVRRRIEDYLRQTQPLLDLLGRDGRLRDVNADLPIAEVREALGRVVSDFQGCEGAEAR